MSILVVQIPPRQRLHTSGALAPAVGSELNYVVGRDDGLELISQGRCAPALLPTANTVVAVLADTDVAWHRITLPKAPAARLRAALVGVLEEALLDEPESTHFAVAPDASAGAPTWVAATHHAWLRAVLAELEEAKVFVDRVVPASWPDVPPSGHFAEVDSDPDRASQPARYQLTWSHADGVVTLPLQGGLGRALLPQPAPPGTRWSSTPAAAATAERWLGAPLAVMNDAQRSLQATRTTWNLRQFDLARKGRGGRALRDSVRHFMSSEWRPVRWGIAAVLLLQLAGLNLWAAHLRGQLTERRAAMAAVLSGTFPQVRAVLDAPLQMERELQTLRTLAGKAGAADLEPALQAAAAAWPADRPPVDALSYEPGRLTLAANGWSDAQVAQFKQQLQPAGWTVELTQGRLSLSRAAPARTGGPL